MGRKRAGAFDAMVGETIHALRFAKGVSQASLANALGVSFQQVQKYEKGHNRIGAGRLAQIAHALDVPVDMLLQGVEGAVRKTAPNGDPLTLLSTSQAMRLAKAFAQIRSYRVRLHLVQLAEKIAAEER